MWANFPGFGPFLPCESTQNGILGKGILQHAESKFYSDGGLG